MQKRHGGSAAPPPVVTEYQVLAKQCPACEQRRPGVGRDDRAGAARAARPADRGRFSAMAADLHLLLRSLLSGLASWIAVPALIGIAVSLRPHFRPHAPSSSGTRSPRWSAGWTMDPSTFPISPSDHGQVCRESTLPPPGRFPPRLKLLDFRRVRRRLMSLAVMSTSSTRTSRSDCRRTPLDDEMRDLTGGSDEVNFMQLSSWPTVTIRALRPNPDRELRWALLRFPSDADLSVLYPMTGS